MKVILLQDIKGLGKKGEIVETAEGYGRNYLLPKKMAKEANAANVNQAKKDQATAAHRAAQAKDEAIVLGHQVEKVVVKMTMRVGENGRVFGSINSKDVAEALVKQTGLNIDRRKVEIKNTIKNLGEYTAVAKLHTDVTAQFKVMVVKEEA